MRIRLVTFLIARAKYLKRAFMEREFIWVHSLKGTVQYDREGAALGTGHAASAVRKHKDTNTSTQPVFSSLFSPETHFIG